MTTTVDLCKLHEAIEELQEVLVAERDYESMKRERDNYKAAFQTQVVTIGKLGDQIAAAETKRSSELERVRQANADLLRAESILKARIHNQKRLIEEHVSEVERLTGELDKSLLEGGQLTAQLQEASEVCDRLNIRVRHLEYELEGAPEEMAELKEKFRTLDTAFTEYSNALSELKEPNGTFIHHQHVVYTWLNLKQAMTNMRLLLQLED